MKDYPSIPRQFQQYKAYIFDKLDGSSLRSEWTKKAGWAKHGKRTGLIDGSNPHIEEAMPNLFLDTLAIDLERLARNNRWRHMVVFYEFWGLRSIAGLHYDGDPKALTLFDASIDKKGILGPKRFREAFEDKVPTAKFLGIHNWTRGFVERVLQGDVEGITFEGVVGKAGDKHKIIRTKAKTQAWKDRVKEIHGDRAEAIFLS